MNQKKIGWNFDNTYIRFPERMFSRLNPISVCDPKLILRNNPLAKNLNLNFKDLTDKEIAELFSGNIIPDGAEPIAQAYAGHQYGHLNLLGDGRASLLGEHDGFDIQLKGSGPTPYSRQGDGRAALGPMLREYLISEAMFALGIPTTRSLAVVATGEEVFRETNLPGAILTRVAASHIRIGTFEYIAMVGDIELLKTMVSYCIDRHYPHLKKAENPTLALLKAVIDKQIILITHWMRVGFVHGVMNTDNMTISGETIDYGPCAFMDAYNPETVFSSIDRRGRYAFGNQPQIAEWNLARFAETLMPLLHENQEKALQIAQEVLEGFSAQYQTHYLGMMRNKLGLFGEENEDERLINDLLVWMQENKADYTNTFRSLITGNFVHNEGWNRRWQARLSNGSFELMRANNPAVIPRNHKVEAALKAASVDNDLATFNRLLEVLSNPYEDTPIDLAGYQVSSEIEEGYKTFCGT